MIEVIINVLNNSIVNQPSDNGKDKFLHSQARYRGDFSPQNLAFNANLQEFAQKIGYVCALETNGKISPEEAYDRIKDLWQQLKDSKEKLLGD